MKLAALALVTALSLTACSSGESDVAKEDAKETTVTLNEEQEAKKEQADVAPGEAVVPGSIESAIAGDLSSECESAITPARELAKKYKSGLLVPADDQTVNTVLAAARTACDSQDFAEWYYDEFVGWQNAKP